jgi:putative N6-adenine-specific DNA methylase
LKLVAKTFSGLENVLAKEISEIGGKNVKPGNRAVFFEGNQEMLYKSNYFLRCALRILKEIDVFQFKNTDQFYLRCKKIEWSRLFSPEQDFAVSSTVFRSKEFQNSMFASLKVKDAIVDYFRQKCGKRPNVNTNNPEIRIHIHVYENTCTLSLDSSGESLHKRGYRVKQGEAPLNEVLAAGMILISGWNGNSDLLDPMCGSGTIPIEAALIAQNIPAGKFRKTYAFENWPDFNPLLFEKIKKGIEKKVFNHKIYASDISGNSILNAQTNARRALVFNKIEFSTCNIQDLNISTHNATIIINPPYGERLKQQNLTGLYSLIGERLKHRFAGNSAWILTNSVEGIKNIGLKSSAKMDLFNGALKCKYINYNLFKGKHKSQKTTKGN